MSENQGIREIMKPAGQNHGIHAKSRESLRLGAENQENQSRG